MRVQIINEAQTGDPAITEKWELSLQWCLYVYDDGTNQHGYRFIWRRPDGSLQPARGQARIPSLVDAEKLMAEARSEGWGDYSS